jgi:circadian clock protein KaiB
MTLETTANVTEGFEAMLAANKQEHYVLRLYVAGMTNRSMNAVASLKALCEQLLSGRYELEVINLLDHPELAEAKQILASPTLVKELPLPVRRLVGDLTTPDRVLLVLQ